MFISFTSAIGTRIAINLDKIDLVEEDKGNGTILTLSSGITIRVKETTEQIFQGSLEPLEVYEFNPVKKH